MTNIESLKKYVGKEHRQEAEAVAATCEKGRLAGLAFKNPSVALILSIFLGMLGIDRLYQGGLKMFGCKLAMVALTFGTWWLADIYFNKHVIEEENFEKLLAAAA